jgi:prepilin-type N-terminal cleavage/methylation domain-containing protein
MATTLLKSLLSRSWRSHRSNNTKGFTLIELLVVALIAGGLVSGLMYLVVELLSTDQRDSSRNETQRDMQTALDYINGELRESIYIYTGECLVGQGSVTNPNPTNPADPPFCPGIVNHIPTSLNPATNRGVSVPILAFWKQQALPDAVRRNCAANANNPPVNTPCLSGHSPALVVYSLNRDNAGSVWSERNARITRYALTQFDNNGVPVRGYVDPVTNNTFQTWPYGGTNFTDLQIQAVAAGRPTGNATVLTDFVDDGRGAVADSVSSPGRCPDDPATLNPVGTPPDYSLSPPNALLTGAFTNVRSFYACVSTSTDLDNRDVLLYLRGNASGRPGINSDRAFLPTLSTRVMTRGVLGKDPATQD